MREPARDVRLQPVPGPPDRLRAHVEQLSVAIGERHVGRYAALVDAAAFVDATFRSLGVEACYDPFRAADLPCANVEATIPGVLRPHEIVVVGAHYDTAAGTPGANDNASGVAAVIELARAFARRPIDRTLRLVAFANEERPFLRTRAMGSYVYAERSRARGDRIVAMLSLETLGRRGTLFAIADWRSRRLARLMRHDIAAGGLAAHAVVAPRWLPGANSSDHWSFWKHGSPAVMLTDASAWRDARSHRRTDRADLIDYAFLAAAVHGVSTAVARLTRLVA